MIKFICRIILIKKYKDLLRWRLTKWRDKNKELSNEIKKLQDELAFKKALIYNYREIYGVYRERRVALQQHYKEKAGLK